jgi:hypothetical protein
MTLQSSGAISASQINTELAASATATIGLNDTTARTLAGIPSGAISMSHFYGTSSAYDWAIFGGGQVSTGRVATTDKHTYTSNVNTAATALGGVQSALAATGNSTVGIFGGGSPSTSGKYTNKYTYANDTVSPGTLLGAFRQGLGATGNATIGIFGWGDFYSNSTMQNYLDKYTYATDTVAAATVFGTGYSWLAAAGNSTIGIFSGGQVSNSAYSGANSYVNLFRKYTYASDTNTGTTTSGITKAGQAAAGNATVGLFSGGFTGLGVNVTLTGYSDLYTYASNTVTQATGLAIARGLMAAAGNPTVAIFAGGTSSTNATSYISAKQQYTYASNTSTTRVALSQARHSLAAASATMGF